MKERNLAALVGCASLVLSACGGGANSTASSTPQTQTPNAEGPAWMRAENDSLATRMRAISTSLAGASFRPAADESRGFLVGGENATLALRIPAHRCLVVTSVTSPGIHDLDATMFSPEGEVLAEDVEEDAHPSTVACAADVERPVYVVVRAFDGSGAYLSAAFVGSEDQVGQLGALLGGQPGVAATSEEGVAESARERDLAIGAGRRGMERLREPFDLTLVRGQAVRVPIRGESGHCYTFAAFAADGVRNLDSRALDAQDHELVRDVSPQRDTALQFCVERTEQISIEVTAVDGSGAARIAIYGGEAAQAGGLSTNWLGETATSARARARAGATIAPLLDGLVARGYRVSARHATSTLRVGGAWEGSVRVEAGSCVAVLVASGDGLGRVSILARASNETQSAMTRTPAGSLSSTTHLCADASAKEYEILISAEHGQGELVVVYAIAPSALNEELRRGL